MCAFLGIHMQDKSILKGRNVDCLGVMWEWVGDGNTCLDTAFYHNSSFEGQGSIFIDAYYVLWNNQITK